MKLKVFILLTCFCGVLSAEHYLVKNGVPCGGIYLDRTAGAGEKAAAEELQTYLYKISGAGVSVQTERQNSIIILGTVNTHGIPEMLKMALQGKKDEAYLIKTLNNKLYIIGKTQVGTLYGAYGLLSDYLHVRWFMPGEEYVEEKQTIVLPDVNCVEEPYFLWRTVSQTSAGGLARDSKVWAARNRLQCPSGALHDPAQKDFFEARNADHVIDAGGHLAFYNAVPPQKYLKSNPEYFALVNGRRQQNTNHNNTHHCLSNSQVQKLTANHISTLYRQYGRRITYLFGAPDSVKNWCECEKCRLLDAGERLDVSRRYHAVVQKIAKMVYARHPDVRLDVWAYANYRNVPDGVKIDPRMNVYFCTHARCYAHRIDDQKCVRNVRIMRQLREWIALKPHAIHLYEYAHCTPGSWTPLEKVLAADLKTFRKMRIAGWKEEIAFPDANYRVIPAFEKDPHHPAHRLGYNWLYFCVAGKLTWNPDLDVDKVIGDLESKYYGKAYPAMKKFNRLRREAWNNSHGCFGYPFGDGRTPALLMKPGVRAEMLDLLDKAEQLAGNDPVLLRRLKRDRQYFEVFWIWQNDQYRAGKAAPLNAPRAGSEISVDGDPSDPAWLGARWISDFKAVSAPRNTNPAGAGDFSVGILADKSNLYFLHLSNPGYDSEEIEILLDPGNDRGKYYRIQTDKQGKVSLVQLPDGTKVFNTNLLAAAGRADNCRAVEIKVPMKNLDGIFLPGALWNIHIVRTLPDGTSFALRGIDKHDRSCFSSFVIGEAIVENGDFSELDAKNGQPVRWTVNNGRVVKKSGRNVLSIAPHGSIQYLIWNWNGPLGQSSLSRRIKVHVRASGSGTLQLKALNYYDDWGGGDLKRTSHPAEKIGDVKLKTQAATYSFDYTIKPDRWIGLSLYAPGGAVIEKVFVSEK